MKTLAIHQHPAVPIHPAIIHTIPIHPASTIHPAMKHDFMPDDLASFLPMMCALNLCFGHERGGDDIFISNKAFAFFYQHHLDIEALLITDPDTILRMAEAYPPVSLEKEEVSPTLLRNTLLRFYNFLQMSECSKLA